MTSTPSDALSNQPASTYSRRCAVFLMTLVATRISAADGTQAKKKKKKHKKKLKPTPISRCLNLGQSCTNNCCTGLICQEVADCQFRDGPHCCSPTGTGCQSHCDCCGTLNCSERQASTCHTCAVLQETCDEAADCCGKDATCADNGCAASPVCVQAEGGACVGTCDCGLDLVCSDRRADTCQHCALPQVTCSSSDDCCFANSSCADNGCAESETCCQGEGASCIENCDCCADYVCDGELAICVRIVPGSDAAERAARSGPTTVARRGGVDRRTLDVYRC